MRRDHPIQSWWTVNPPDDFDAKYLLLAYCIGDDTDPDEVIDIRARGDFRIDSALREEIRGVSWEGHDALSDTQEIRMPPQGHGMGALFETWLQAPLTLNVAGSITGGAILSGCAKLWRKYHGTGLPAQVAQGRPTISPEDLFGRNAGGTVAQHYTTTGTPEILNLVITETHSAYEHGGTVDLIEQNGRTFHVNVSLPASGWRVTHIIREHPGSADSGRTEDLVTDTKGAEDAPAKGTDD